LALDIFPRFLTVSTSTNINAREGNFRLKGGFALYAISAVFLGVILWMEELGALTTPMLRLKLLLLVLPATVGVVTGSKRT